MDAVTPPGAAPRVLVVDDAGALHRLAAGTIAEAARRATGARGRFTIALSGGSTPGPVHRLLATAHRDHVAWARVHVFFGDDRCVPPDDPRSNYRLARETLLDHVPIPPEQVHRVLGELAPEEAAARYDTLLRETFAGGAAVPAMGHATFDLAVQGVGPDGHTASLFPGRAELAERERWAVAAAAPPLDPPVPRVTVTFPVLWGAEEVLVLVTGRAKAPVVRAATAPDPGPDAPPAALARGRLRTTWIVTRDAAP